MMKIFLIVNEDSLFHKERRVLKSLQEVKIGLTFLLAFLLNVFFVACASSTTGINRINSGEPLGLVNKKVLASVKKPARKEHSSRYLQDKPSDALLPVGWWKSSWRRQQQNALQCWLSPQCMPVLAEKPKKSLLKKLSFLNDNLERRRSAQVLLRENFLSSLNHDFEAIEQIYFQDEDAIFLLADLGQLLAEHSESAVELERILKNAAPAMRTRNEFYEKSRRQNPFFEEVSYNNLTEWSVGVSSSDMSEWAKEIILGTIVLKKNRMKNYAVIALLRGQSIKRENSVEGFLVDDGKENQQGIPRCFMGDVPAAAVRVGGLIARQEEMKVLDVKAKAECRAARRGKSVRWALAMGSIAQRQVLKKRAQLWQARLLAASYLALHDARSLSDSADFWGNKAMFESSVEDKKKPSASGASYGLNLAPTGDVELGLFALVLGGAVDHVMAVRHGSAWAQKKGRDDVKKTLKNIETVFLDRGIRGVFKIAGEEKASAALLLASF